MVKYYSEQECLVALEHAKKLIASRKGRCSRIIRNYNCCYVLGQSYSDALRGMYEFGDNWHSQLDDFLNTRGMEIRIQQRGFETIEEFILHQGFEVVKDRKPKVGDLAIIAARNNEVATAIADGDESWTGILGNGRAGSYSRRRLFERTLVGLYRPVKE